MSIPCIFCRIQYGTPHDGSVTRAMLWLVASNPPTSPCHTSISTSTLSSQRRTTLLSEQPIDIFCHRQQSQQQLHSTSTGNLRRQLRRSTIFRRLTSKLESSQSDSGSFNEHPEKFIRTLLTRLFDSIKSEFSE